MERADRRLGALVGVAVALGFLLAQSGEVTVKDGADMLAVAHSILHHGTLAVPAPYGALGRGGAYYAKYGLGLSLVVLPLLALADLVALVIHHQAQLESFAASSAMPIITGLLSTTLWHTTRKLGATRQWSTVVAVGAAVGTYALPYGKDFFSEPLTALLITVAINEILAARYATAGLALALAVITRPEAVVLLAVIPLILWIFRGFRSALVCGAAASIGAIIDATYNQYRFGSMFNSGYRGETFSTPLLHGAEGLLLGTNKSLLLFAPIVVLLIPAGFRLWRNNLLFVCLAASNFVIFFVLAALWHSWQGGWSWGPRLILPGVVTALPLLASATKYEKRVGAGLLLLGFAISASTLIVPTEAQQLDHPPPTNGPAVIRQYELVPSAVRYSAHHLRAAHVLGIHRKYVGLWQVNVGRELGTKGLLFGLIGSLMLLAAFAAVLTRLMSLLADRRVAPSLRAGSSSMRFRG